MIQNNLFYCKNKDIYPPFKNGLYLEEYFLKKYKEYTEKNIITKRKYIPALWTNFQIEGWFANKKPEMQTALNNWVAANPSENGYFTVVQYDDGPLLLLPANTIVYGACSGNIPIPLIYEDINNTLSKIKQKKFNEKSILCSFIGNITANHIIPNVRQLLFEKFKNNHNFIIINSGGWTPNVNTQNQDIFINNTINSKFAFAPRGYGRSSFRFFEIFLLGSIPIYIWNDENWLPFQNIIDYDKLCISMHISQINELENQLLNITEEKYNLMLKYYNEIKHLFELEGMTNQIINNNL